MATAARRAERLVEQLEHRPPGAFVGAAVVGHAGHAELIGPLVGEAVDRAAVEVQLPVDLAGAHLLLERMALLDRHERVVGADARQHAPDDVAGVGRAVVPRPEWKPTTALRSAPARASSSTRVPPKQKPMAATRSGSVCSCARSMSRPWPSRRMRSVSPMSAPRRATISSRQGLAVAVVVEGEGDVAEAGEPLGPPLGVLVEPRSLVGDEHGRPPPWPLVVDGQVAQEPDVVHVVLDVGGVHRRPLWCQ